MDNQSARPIEVARIPASPWRDSIRNPSLLILMREIATALHGCQTVLDVGCGNSSPLRYHANSKLTGIDGYAPSIEEARRNRTHDDFVLGDVTQVGKLFPPKQFDACIALDLIEHLEKPHGWLLLKDLERIARRRVVIFTPNGFVPQCSQNGDLQEHLSGWEAAEMRNIGYRVYGMYGPKALRGEYHRVKRRPRFLWALWSIFRHYTGMRNCPEKSAAIFCVKNLG